MSIDKAALFESTKALWPETVRVSANPDAMTDIYRNNEQSFPESDEWRQLALWSFHQALAIYEKRASAKGIGNIYPREVTFAEFDKWMRSNLNGADCWLEERAQYEAE